MARKGHHWKFEIMVKWISLTFLVLECGAVCSQHLKRIESYECERHYYPESVSTDTVLSSIEFYDTSGYMFQNLHYMYGMLYQEEYFWNDTLHHVHLPGTDRLIEYRYDEHGNVISMVEGRDTSIYANQYLDSLVIHTKCIAGCNYEAIYIYNDQGRIIEYIRMSGSKREAGYSWEAEYDDQGRITRWIIDNTIFEHEYMDEQNMEVEVSYTRDDHEEMERTVTYYNDDGQPVFMEHYLQGRPLRKKFYKYIYYND